MGHRHPLWIERISERIGFPLWAGVATYVALSFIVFLPFYLIAGQWNLFLSTDIFYVLFALPVLFLLLLCAAYVRTEIAALEEYALSMAKDSQSIADRLASLPSLKAVVILAIVFEIASGVPFILQRSESASVLQNVIVEIPWFVVQLVAATSVWVSGYSMFAIYRIGKLPLNLQPFTKDSALGLKPFASVSLRLTAVYYLYISVQLVVDVASVGFTLFVFIRDAALILLGLLLFVLPLFSIHRKLVQAKAEEMMWINDRYTRIMARIKSNAEGSFDEGTQRDLASVEKIQKDIRAIQPWPFDISFLTKLVAIFLSVTAILLSRIIQQLLRI